MKRRPAAIAARRAVSRSSRSPFGSTTTAACPRAIARSTINASVTVFPDPVAPTISVWLPLLAPKGSRTGRRSPPVPIVSVPRTVARRGRSQAHAQHPSAPKSTLQFSNM
jgi:hypothetical protein